MIQGLKERIFGTPELRGVRDLAKRLGGRVYTNKSGSVLDVPYPSALTPEGAYQLVGRAAGPFANLEGTPDNGVIRNGHGNVACTVSALYGKLTIGSPPGTEGILPFYMSVLGKLIAYPDRAE